MKEIILHIFGGIYKAFLFVLGIVALYLVSQILSGFATILWSKLFGYNLFAPSSSLAIPSVYIVSITSSLIVAKLFWTRSRAVALGALIGMIPLIFINSFA